VFNIMENNVFLNGVSRNDLAFALGFSCHGYKNRTDRAEDMRAARERVRKALGESMAMDGLMAFIEDMEKPRPIRFADLPVVDSLDQLSLGHQIELLRDALDHIAKTCHQSRQQSRRIRWIEARANGALEGKPYDAKLLDLPIQVDREIDRFKRRDGRQMARIRELEQALKFYADREHYHFESGNWDTVSGEPLNILWNGDEPDFIEDGSVARAALKPVEGGDQLNTITGNDTVAPCAPQSPHNYHLGECIKCGAISPTE